MLADVFGRQVSLPNISEGAAFGAGWSVAEHC
jgi:sugar (pentulose or hexulose) kinase